VVVTSSRSVSGIRPTLIAALVAGLIPAGWFAGYQWTAAHPLLTGRRDVLELSLLAYCYSVAISFVCGYATLSLLRRLAAIRWWTASLSGIAWGGLMLYLLGNPHIEIKPLLSWLAVGGLCGATFLGAWRYATP
jgi:hypothetical protein